MSTADEYRTVARLLLSDDFSKFGGNYAAEAKWFEAAANRLDAEQAVDAESFEFLNELALAFRSGEKHARPQHTPVLEGIRAVLAHLQSTGRLIPAGGRGLEFSEVEALRSAWEELKGYRVDGYARPYVNQIVKVVGDLFPATEPAEEETKAEEFCCHPKCRFTDWGGINRKHERGADCPIVPKPASSPVVPAPTETGPWQDISEAPKHLTLIDRVGDKWTYDGDNWVTPETAILPVLYINRKCAPFVAAEEG